MAFSPNGAHLAVGCVTGAIKVLNVENLTQKVGQHTHTNTHTAVGQLNGGTRCMEEGRKVMFE